MDPCCWVEFHANACLQQTNEVSEGLIGTYPCHFDGREGRCIGRVDFQWKDDGLDGMV